MRILLATTDPDEIRWATERQWADGVFTTPILLARAGTGDNGAAVLADAWRLTGAPVYACVQSVHAEEMYPEARELARAAEQVIVVLPLIEEAVPVMRRLTSEGVQVGANFVFNGAQALLAAKAGAVAVIVPFADHEAYGQSGFEVLQEIRSVLDSSRLECDLVAATPRTAAELGGCATAGVDAVILETDALRAFATHPLTDRGVDRYLHDLARLARPRAV